MSGFWFGFDLLRLDIDPAGDDALGGAAGEEQIAVLVHIAHVADGEGDAAIQGRRGVQARAGPDRVS